MNPEHEIQRRLDVIADVIAWWLRTTHEQHVELVRLALELERLEAKLADARVARTSTEVRNGLA